MKKENELAEMCVRQYIRNRLVEILTKHCGSNINPQEVMDEINEKMIKGFVEIARDEISKTLKKTVEKL